MTTDSPTEPDADHADRLIDLLRCPVSKAELVRDGERLVSRDEATRLAYPIRDGFPVMLAEEATELDRDQWQAIVSPQ